jgi:hypothetical protein
MNGKVEVPKTGAIAKSWAKGEKAQVLLASDLQQQIRLD